MLVEWLWATEKAKSREVAVDEYIEFLQIEVVEFRAECCDSFSINQAHPLYTFAS